MRTRQRLLPTLLGASLALAACTSAATPAPTTAPSASAAATNTTDGSLPTPELSSIKIGASVQEISQFAPKLAEMEKIYDKYGLHVTFSTFNADGDALQAMLSGSVDMASVGPAGIINTLLTDAPSTSFTEQKIKVVDHLLCNSAIKTAADLKGKPIAVSTLGGTAEASVMLALTALKMQLPDVVIVPVGGESVRIAAMKSGSVSCAPIGVSNVPPLLALGFNDLVDLNTVDAPYPATGLSAPNSFVKKNPKTVLVAVAANLEAQNMIWTDPNTVAKDWASYAQIDVTKALPLVTDGQNQLNRSLVWPASSFVFTQQVMAIVTPGIMTVDATKSMDLSYLKTLQDNGFYKKINSPLPSPAL